MDFMGFFGLNRYLGRSWPSYFERDFRRAENGMASVSAEFGSPSAVFLLPLSRKVMLWTSRRLTLQNSKWTELNTVSEWENRRSISEREDNDKIVSGRQRIEDTGRHSGEVISARRTVGESRKCRMRGGARYSCRSRRKVRHSEPCSDFPCRQL